MNDKPLIDLQNDKYVVLKKEDFDRMLGKLELPGGSSIAEEAQAHLVKDAVVIRRQDRFAASAFDTYSSQILGYLEIAEDMGIYDPELEALADFFADQAHLARQGERKLPD